MPLMQWTDALSVGVPSIDAQHQTLVAILNRFHDAMLERRSGELLGEVFAELIAYTEVHFSYEEALLEEHGYAELAMHRAQHQGLTRRVRELMQDHQEGRLSVTLELMEFLRDWLRNHIVGTDRRYAALLQTAGVT